MLKECRLHQIGIDQMAPKDPIKHLSNFFLICPYTKRFMTEFVATVIEVFYVYDFKRKWPYSHGRDIINYDIHAYLLLL